MEEGHTGGGSLAVVIPCLNEEMTIGKVVEDARRSFPSASVYVFDNGSTDGSVERARSAGAGVDPLDTQWSPVWCEDTDVSIVDLIGGLRRGCERKGAHGDDRHPL